MVTQTKPSAAVARKSTPQKYNVVRDEAFAKRLQIACENHGGVPPLHSGRLTWIVRQFKEKFDTDITTETARKWNSGEVRPRPKSMAKLAQLLQVDEVWLSIGSQSETTADQRKARNSMAGAAVNLVAGLIEMDGGHPAYPEADDKRGQDVDIFAIIKGAQYAFKIAVGHADGKALSFAVPNNYKDLFVIGLVRTGPFQFDLLELDAATIDKNRDTKGGHVAITVDKRGAAYFVDGQKLKQIAGFDQRP